MNGDLTLEYMKTPYKPADLEEAVWDRVQLAMLTAHKNGWTTLDLTLSEVLTPALAKKFKRKLREQGFNSHVLIKGDKPENNPHGKPANDNSLRIAWVDYPEPPPPEPEEQPLQKIEEVTEEAST